MAIINIPNDGATLTLNGYTFRSLVQGDFIQLDQPNNVSEQTYSTQSGMTVQERNDADVTMLTINIEKHSDDHDFMIQQANLRNPLTIFTGSLKTNFTKDGDDRVHTWFLENGTVQKRGSDTRNNETPNSTAAYSIMFRRGVESQ